MTKTNPTSDSTSYVINGHTITVTRNEDDTFTTTMEKVPPKRDESLAYIPKDGISNL